MGLRMIASVLIFQAGSNAIGWLIKNFTKLSDSEEIAKNKLDEYNESLTNLNKTLASSEGNISAGIGVDNAKAQEALRITNDTTKSLRERINAYSDLQNLLPNVLKNLTEEEKLNGKFIADNDLIIKEARIKNELAAASANLESATKAVALNRIALTETGKNLEEANDPNNAKNFSLVHYRNADTEARFKQVELLKTQKAAQDAYNKSYSEYNSIKTIDDKKQPHTKSDLNEKLKTIENERKTKDEESKKNYELSAKSFNDEYRLLTDNLEHENEAYVKSKKLLDKYLSDKKISLVDYNEKFSALQKEQATIAAQGAATQDKIDSEIRAERLKQENADVEYINKLEEHAKKLGEINAKLQDEQVRHSIAMKAIGKKGHEYDAQKFAISEKENEVRNDNANISNIKSQLNAANISVGITESTPIEDRSKRQFQESEKDFSERSRLIKELSDLEQKEATDTANVVELQDQPSQKPRHMNAENIGDGSRAANHRQIALIEVGKWRQRRFAFNFAGNHPRGV